MRISKLIKSVGIIFFLLVFYTLNLNAHSDDDHSSENHDKESTGSIEEVKKTILEMAETHSQINANYEANVKLIFDKKCDDCHGKAGNKPWYYKVPGVKQFLDSHIEEAKEHLDITVAFPFKGHGSVLKTLKEIKEVVVEGEMPLWSYRIMHKGSSITKAEEITIINWVDDSIQLLKQ